MAYQIIFAPAVRRALAKLPQDLQGRIIRKIESLAENPRPPGVEKLSGAEDLYRVRTGEYRIVYSIEDRTVTVTIVRVGHRKDIYRKR